MSERMSAVNFNGKTGKIELRKGGDQAFQDWLVVVGFDKLDDPMQQVPREVAMEMADYVAENRIKLSDETQRTLDKLTEKG